MDDLLARNNLTLNEEMQLSNDRVACGVCDEQDRKYYIIYQGVGAVTETKEKAKELLNRELIKRFK